MGDVGMAKMSQQEKPAQAAIRSILAMQTDEHRQRLRTFINALPSYQQGRGALCISHEGAEAYCCLGVAIEEAIKAGANIVKVHPDVPSSAGTWWVMYRDTDSADRSTTSLTQTAAAFYGLRGGNWVHRTDPRLEIPPTIEAPPGGWADTFVSAQQANDTLRLNFEQIAECFKYTYLRADWEAKHPTNITTTAGEDDVAAS